MIDYATSHEQEYEMESDINIKTQHTPPPWRVRTRIARGNLVDYFVVADNVNGFACDTEILGCGEYRDDVGGSGTDRQFADATLVAAAPYLLEAAKSALRHIMLEPYPNGTLALDLAAAISQAETVVLP